MQSKQYMNRCTMKVLLSHASWRVYFKVELLACIHALSEKIDMRSGTECDYKPTNTKINSIGDSS